MTKQLEPIRATTHGVANTARRTSCISTLLLALLCSPLAFANHPDPLPDFVTTANLQYGVGYTSNSPYVCMSPAPGDDLNFIPDDIAIDMAAALDGNGS